MTDAEHEFIESYIAEQKWEHLNPNWVGAAFVYAPERIRSEGVAVSARRRRAYEALLAERAALRSEHMQQVG